MKESTCLGLVWGDGGVRESHGVCPRVLPATLLQELGACGSGRALAMGLGGFSQDTPSAQGGTETPHTQRRPEKGAMSTPNELSPINNGWPAEGANEAFMDD